MRQGSGGAMSVNNGLQNAKIRKQTSKLAPMHASHFHIHVILILAFHSPSASIDNKRTER